MKTSPVPVPEPARLTAGEAEDFLPSVYENLRKIAAHQLAALGPGQTLQPTALVHEAWLRMANADLRVWQNRVHYLATAAGVIRRVLIDHLRSKSRFKRGGGQLRLDIDGLEIAGTTADEKVLLIDEALDQLHLEHPDKARVVVLKFFGGLTDREVAAELKVTERTVERHWAYARAWLLRQIRNQS